MSSSKKYKCPYCDYRNYRDKLITHVERKHDDMIPKDYTPARVVYNSINRRDHGTCMICGKETEWDENKQRYNSLCGNKKCKDEYVKIVHSRMMKKYGKTNLLTDPEFQKKMLENRSISGKYKFEDGGSIGYVGSYEKNFLEFMDKFLHIKSYDIISPGPTIPYIYKGKEHVWITDFLYEPYNLVFDVKDGGDNPNNREMAEYREKQIAKEKAIIEYGEYNYIRLTDNKFEQLIQIFMELKEKVDDKPLVRINESAEILNESAKKYDPPYSAKQVKQVYGEDIYTKLSNDPAHRYRMDTGIELIHKEPTLEELNRIHDNWNLISKADKIKSDKKSIELFGKTNEEHYKELLSYYDESQSENQSYIISLKEDNNMINKFASNKSLYHLSKYNLDGKTLYPRVPSNFLVKNGYEDGKIERVCFARSIDGSLRGMSQNLTGMKLYVHIPDGKYNVYMPTTKQVPDCKITSEVWVKEPVKLKCIGQIEVLKDRGEDGISYKYGNNTAELYDWDWKWIEKINESTDVLNENFIINKIIQESEDESHLDKNFKKKSGKSFRYIDINSPTAKKYLMSDSECSKKIDYIYKNRRGEIVIDIKEDKLAGYIFICKDKRNDGYIQPLYLFKEYRGYGLSNKLLDDAIKKYNAIDLHVYKDNEVAINLYKNHGFTIIEMDDEYNKKGLYYMKLKNKIDK